MSEQTNNLNDDCGNDLTNEKYKEQNLTDIVSCRNLSEISPCVPRSCCELRNS